MEVFGFPLFKDLFLKVLSVLLSSKTGRYGRESGRHAAKDHGQESNPGLCGQAWPLMVRGGLTAGAPPR